jgi:hypothetical protein
MNAISALMLSCGGLLTAGSVARWFDFYQSVLATLYRLHESDYCGLGICKTFIDMAQNFSASAYPQQLFCIGLGLIALGVMSRIAACFRY